MTLSHLRYLELSDAGNWPPIIKTVVVVLIIAAVGAAGYYLDTKTLLERLQVEKATEQNLRDEFQAKQRVAANIDAYRAQLEKLKEMLATMLQQLPTRTEMPDLLEDISNIGKTNGLSFQVFQPRDEQPREFYAAKPISIRARATYHQFGAFISSISALPRIVTLENARLTASQPRTSAAGQLQIDFLNIEATLQTYRYLDEQDHMAQASSGG